MVLTIAINRRVYTSTRGRDGHCDSGLLIDGIDVAVERTDVGTREERQFAQANKSN